MSPGTIRLFPTLYVVRGDNIARRKENPTGGDRQHASSGDPQRTMKLLWGVADAPTRGPKPALTVEDIVRAAVELADAEGLAAVSMRKVAERLGKSAMSLYSYVPGKAELLDLMIDRTSPSSRVTYSASPDGVRRSSAMPATRGDTSNATRGWSRSRAPAPCSARTSSTATRRDSPCSTASDLRRPRSSRRLLHSMGCSAGRPRSSRRLAAAEQATGQSDDDWWTERSPLLDTLSEDIWDKRYPVSSRLGAEHAFDQLDRPDDSTPYLERAAIDGFDFGLARLLDGIEAMIASRSPTKRAIKRPAAP